MGLINEVPVNGAAEYGQSHTWLEALEELKAATLHASNVAVTVFTGFPIEYSSRRAELFNWLFHHLTRAREQIEALKCSFPPGQGRGRGRKRAADVAR